jgi:hypothetical protein
MILFIRHSVMGYAALISKFRLAINLKPTVLLLLLNMWSRVAQSALCLTTDWTAGVRPPTK